ncbi:MAG TPA: alkaline phosphatase family protein [Candidatus Saccharimonadales bacterium]|nr:alkaline phosphatase family protein [Candidatus Saccharimonadales bacterium]
MKRQLFVLIDAMGWEVVCRHHAFETLAPNRRPLETVLGYSSGAIPTILSGRMPREHGHWALFPRALGRSPFAWTAWLRLLPRSWQHRYRVRRFIREATRQREHITGYFQIYDVPVWLLARLDYAERHDLWTPGGLAPEGGVFDRWREQGRAYFSSGWEGPDEDKFARALRTAADPAVRAYFVYATELDALMHRVGTHDLEVGALLRRYEDRTAALVRALAAGGEEPELWVFSDHGMTDTVASHDLMGEVAGLGLRERRDYLGFYDSTMARFWIERPAAEAPIAGLLRGLPWGALLDRGELRRQGLDFSDRRYGDLIFLMQPGHLIAPSYMGRGAPEAMHGFHPDHPDSAGALLSPRPLPEDVRHIRDLYRLLVGDVGSGAGGGGV